MNLNPQQIEAVHHKEGPLLILAGAGTGKTRVIVNRIAHLVQNGVPPARILAVTFTNKAAGEMKKRVEQLVGRSAQEMWVGTFHSTSLRILRRFALEAGVAPNFVVYDTADQLSCLKQVIKELNLDEKRFPPKSFINKISRWKDQLITAKAFTESARNPIEETFAKIYTAYERILEQNHALDFGDLIARSVFLFQENPKVLEYYQKLWSQVFIDEYQDTNHAQYRWATLLVERHKNICVVGDPDQSIYRWRGADLNNILNFEKDYKEAKVIRLEQNYRSVKKVLDGANAVIANNTLRKEKLLWSDQGEGEPLLAASLSSEKEEAKFVIEHFMRQREAGISYSEMACFYRTNAQSRPLEEALRIAGIPYIIYGGISFYERAEIKDAMAYLRLFHNPHDSVSAKRIINVPPRGIGKTTIDRIDEIAQENQCSFLDAASRVTGHAKLKSFIDWFRVVELKKQNRTLVQFLTEILDSSGYVAGLTQLGTSEAKDRLENLNELVAGVAEFEEGKKADLSLDEKLQEYLERIALITDLDKASDGAGILPLMTLHLAKGLEFKSVAIVGLEEGLLPHSRSQDQLEELEEERRLFYVGMTRAQERLLLTHAWRRYMHGQEQYSLPSRFLEEIPPELVEKQEDKTRRWDSLASPSQEVEYDEFDQRTSEEREEEQSRYRVGMRVKHPSFGSGIVRRSEKTSLGEKLTVQFDNGELKKLIADYVTVSTR